MDFIRCEPLYKERVWGSDDPQDFPLEKLPSDKPVGEAWDISDRPGEQSMVRWDGGLVPFEELLNEHAKRIMGPAWSRGKNFPILVKRLFCQKRLSLQVHPPQNIAREQGVSSKDEFWYVLRARENAKIFAGLKKDVTQADFIAHLNRDDLEPCLHEMHSSRGDTLFIPSGRVHALDAGNVILEIQENSDTTFRVYDWGRVGLDGTPRTLHREQAMSSIDFDDYEPHFVHTNRAHMIVAQCTAFCIHQHVIIDDLFVIEQFQQPRIFSAVDGELFINGNVIKNGESVVLPYEGRFVIHARGSAKFLLTSDFV
jgi:mannose-6-phosphate isomerase